MLVYSAGAMLIVWGASEGISYITFIRRHKLHNSVTFIVICIYLPAAFSLFAGQA